MRTRMIASSTLVLPVTACGVTMGTDAVVWRAEHAVAARSVPGVVVRLG